MLALTDKDIHLWIVDPTGVTDRKLLARYHDLMTADEAAKQQRFVFEKDRRQSLVTRALVRTVLSQYVDVTPDSWRFAIGSHGKPSIVDPPLPLQFNLSHTKNFVLCAVALDHDLGADVEYVERERLGEGIAERYFSASEVNDLHKIPEASRTDRFFDYWTLKEAYIKACGLGLAMPLDKFSFHLNDDSISISFADPDKIPTQWQFWLLRPNDSHRIAVAVNRGAGINYSLSIYQTVPLHGYNATTFPLPIKSDCRSAF